ncbi:BadF/BadG/BcrA/BcrD ATPase family protein [uncultured Sphingomonas sp.]|uniref:BadF/BadG/BcrA/BcrD ATPase family protein n=1 Tax=uncultured Sphingomonas sp. TaxID=158754 RepID=UPI0025D5E1DA|nr:BadF/BadG/BcrA/BcrD ATPase family protein [uncultured Sphingomonas sp.]
MTFTLGIDAGGSHCRARLVDGSGREIGAGQAGAANAGIGIDALRGVLSDVIGQATAGLSPPERAQVRVGMGIAGIRRPGIRAALEATDFGVASVALASDAQVAHLGAHGGGDGAILILGTGSAALLRIDGQEVALGGYGFPVSDEGSGAALGLSAVRHALRALDGRTRRTPLADAVAARFGHDVLQAVAWMATASPRDYGALAPIVMDHADADDPIARSIVEDAAGHVERFVETIVARGVARCTLVGGLAPRLQPWLRVRTAAHLCPPLGDPLDGAVRLARDTALNHNQR